MNIQEARIYVGTYRKYNEGSIDGDWFDLADYSDKDEFLDAARERHADEEDPELMFQDHENIPREMVSESHISENFWNLLNETRNWDSDRLEALAVYATLGRADIDDDDFISEFEDAYQGKYDSETDFAYEVVDQSGLEKSMGHLYRYFDYDSYARDLFIDGFTYFGGFVFRD